MSLILIEEADLVYYAAVAGGCCRSIVSPIQMYEGLLSSHVVSFAWVVNYNLSSVPSQR